jgi:hypothetical protein
MTISATTQGIKPGVCTSTNRPVNPFDGQVIYMTDVDQTAVWDGSQWTVLAPIAGGRNMIINGAMQVHQRGTSTASITTGGYYTADRWNTSITSIGTWTESIENDAPTGSGFRKSLKFLCTTADASPSAGDLFLVRQFQEGQNSQQFLKGTSSAKQFSLSFWVKSNVTGTYIAELRDNDNTRAVSASYTISASATWEKKTIVFPADTTGVFDNDNARSLDLHFCLATGSTYSSGTLATTWESITNANRYVGQTNLAAATNNYWQVTGVQLEVGAVATPFEFEAIGTTLAKCQRYYESGTNLWLAGYGVTSAILDTRLSNYISFNTTKRTSPTVGLSGVTKTNEVLSGGAIWGDPSVKADSATVTGFSLFSKIGTAAGTAHCEIVIANWSAAAEL